MGVLFYCYSAPLKEFLRNKAIRYEVCAINPSTNTMFWAYLQTKELSAALSEWSEKRGH